MGSRHIRLGAIALALALALMVAAAELAPLQILAAAPLLAGPLALVLIGLRELIHGLRLRRVSHLADGVAAVLRERLPSEYLVFPHYKPHEGGEGEVALVVVGPPGVLVIEPRADDGDLVCYQDHWFKSATDGRALPIADSPSRRARWNATRVRSDVATGGFTKTAVEAVVVFTRGRLSDCASSCVPAVEGTDALVAHVTRRASAEGSPQRTRALAEALVGRLRVAPV